MNKEESGYQSLEKMNYACHPKRSVGNCTAFQQVFYPLPQGADNSRGNMYYHSAENKEEKQTIFDRRKLRFQYRNLKNSMTEDREIPLRMNSENFDSFFTKVQTLHDHVQRPREQLADAEALLYITSNFFESVKSSKASDGFSPLDFMNALLRSHCNNHLEGTSSWNYTPPSISWSDIGLEASRVFCDAAGISTMVGPMDNSPKPRKVINSRSRRKPAEHTTPVQVADCDVEDNAETAKNMAIMFNILRKHKQVPLYSLVLNRRSFSQTVENIFALSFLVKDGRVGILTDEDMGTVVVPRNAPTAEHKANGEASYNQFILRFDFEDWKLLKDSVESLQDLMPDRSGLTSDIYSQAHSAAPNGSTSAVIKLSRNRGLEMPPTASEQAINVKNVRLKNDVFEPLPKKGKMLFEK